MILDLIVGIAAAMVFTAGLLLNSIAYENDKATLRVGVLMLCVSLALLCIVTIIKKNGGEMKLGRDITADEFKMTGCCICRSSFKIKEISEKRYPDINDVIFEGNTSLSIIMMGVYDSIDRMANDDIERIS